MKINDLKKRAFGSLLCVSLITAALLFLAAGTFDYWQGWVYLILYSGTALAITQYLLKNDPKLLERRMRAGPGAEKEKSQKIIMSFALIAFMAAIVVPALDHRYGWSKVPFIITMGGDVLVLLGYLIIFFVFKANPFTGATIEHDTEQKIVSTGPYAFVRHPMYFGSLVTLASTPLALGSWWGLFTIIPIKLLVVCRVLEEEKFLIKNLPGYAEYRKKVRYRLVPYLW